MRLGRFRAGLLLGLGIGYVAGSAAGRQRYDQMEAAARRLAGVSRRAIGSGTARSAGDKVGAVRNSVVGKLGRWRQPAAGAPGITEITPYPAAGTPRSSF